MDYDYYTYTTPPLVTDLEFLDFTENENEFYSTFDFAKMYLFSAIKFFLCVFILTCNIILIIIILKFDILQTRINYILLNFAIANSAFSVVYIIGNLLITFDYFMNILDFFNILVMLTQLLVQISYILATLLIVDWFISVTFKNFSFKYHRFYKWAILSCYTTPVLTLFILFITDNPYFLLDVGFIIYWICFLIMVFVNIMKRWKKYTHESLKYAHNLTMGNIYLILWFPVTFISTSHYLLLLYSEVTNLIFQIIINITEIFFLAAYAAPIIMIFILTRRYKHFKMSYETIFKRSVRAYTPVDNNMNEDNIYIGIY